MSEENIRLKALNILKQASAVFVESYQRSGSEKNATARTSVYIEEFASLTHSLKYQDTITKSKDIKPTKLKVSDLLEKRSCSGEFDYCKHREVTDKDVEEFIAPLNKNNSVKIDGQNIDFEKEFDNILNGIENIKSQDINDDNLKLSHSDPIISTQIMIDKDSDNKKNSISNKKSRYPSDDDEKSKEGTTIQLNEKKAFFNNPFKKAKVEEIFSLKSKKTNPIKDSFSKMEKKKNSSQKGDDIDSLRKEYELNIHKSYVEDLANSKLKNSNPWKTERANVVKCESKEVKREGFFHQSDSPKSTKEIFNDKFKTPLLMSNKNDNEVDNKPIEQPKPYNPFSAFRTGNQELDWQSKLQKRPPPKGLSRKRAPNYDDPQAPNNDIDPLRKKFHCPSYPKADNNKKNEDDEPCDLKGFDKEILKRIQREIVVDSKDVSWDDIIGLEGAKKVIKESVILAIKRPDLFTGLRQSTRAIMLFGAPGNGKTLIGKCIASSCDATFLSISSSTLTSKWIGESETLVRAMFTYAKLKQPSVIFFDEIDSLLEKRSEQGNETFNRIKTEFLVQLDGANALKDTDKVLLIGATNRPDVIDEAILRRFTKRILVPLPVKQARVNMFTHLLSKHCHTLNNRQIDKLADYCENYSGSDIAQICKEAAMMSIRRLDQSALESMKVDDIPPISPKDFLKALKNVKPTVSQDTITKLDEWNSKYGSTIDTNRTIDMDDADFFDDDLDDL